MANQPTFAELWPTYSPMLEGIDFLAAHNASFDRSVLHRCCAAAGLDAPRDSFPLYGANGPADLEHQTHETQ